MKKKNEKTVPEKKKSKKKQDVLHQDFTSDSQPALSEEETEDLIQEVIAERRKKGLTEFTTVKKRLNGTVVYIDIPSHIKEWNRKMYGYQLSMQTGVILIRIIPRIKYQKHLLSHEELEKRLLLVRKKYLSMGPIMKFIENPLDVFEREGKLIKLSERAVHEGIHLVMSHYENPEDAEDPDDFLLDHIIHGRT